MTKKLFIFIFFFSLPLFSQKGTWERITTTNVKPNKIASRQTFPSEFTLYSGSVDQIQKSLKQSPERLKTNFSNVIISIPNAEGNLERFQMFEFSNFAPELQAQFPEIRSYIGIGIDESMPNYALVQIQTVFKE